MELNKKLKTIIITSILAVLPLTASSTEIPSIFPAGTDLSQFAEALYNSDKPVKTKGTDTAKDLISICEKSSGSVLRNAFINWNAGESVNALMNLKHSSIYQQLGTPQNPTKKDLIDHIFAIDAENSNSIGIREFTNNGLLRLVDLFLVEDCD